MKNSAQRSSAAGRANIAAEGSVAGIGQQIRDARTRARLSVDEVSTLSGVPNEVIVLLETGRDDSVGWIEASKVARVLGMRLTVVGNPTD